MKPTPLLLLPILIAMMTQFAIAQEEKINSLDENGKKDGKWIVWLDARWKVVNDSSHASYYGYNYFHHGENSFTVSFGSDYKIQIGRAHV